MLELNFKTYGAGENHLIVLHGFLGSLDNWHTLANEWATHGLKVWTLDLRNHGRSPHTEHHSLQLMVDDLNDFMYQHHIDQAYVLGHSMGGKIAMMFALQYEQLCKGLLVADMAPREYKPGHDDVFDAIFQVDLKTIQTRKEAEEAMKPYLGDFGTRQFILKSLERTNEGTYDWKFNLKTLFQDYDEIRKPVVSSHLYNGPTLFIKGGLSRYIKDTDLPSILGLFPEATIETIEDAAHWLHADKPIAFSNIVLSFCK
jgi:esterase